MQFSSPLTSQSTEQKELNCFHCGDVCIDKKHVIAEKNFCCSGCASVYQILNAEGMNDYYCFESSPGTKKNYSSALEKFSYLDNEKIKHQLLDFRSKELSKIKLFIPQIHCSSCIWLLENLHKLNKAVLSSEVNFSEKMISVNFNEESLSLKELVVLLSSIGYEPNISAASKNKKETKNKSIYYKIGIAGFCFGNIMLLSFPTYLGIDDAGFEQYELFFNYLILALSLPVLFYCSTDYFSSAINGLAQKNINIDVPIAIGITALFARSTYEIISGVGPGYLDSFSGLIFFLLLGKWYQAKIYDALNFERDYKSYFPIAVTKIETDENGIKKEESIQLEDLVEGDNIILRNQELIPSDGILLSEEAKVDYSFVSGEDEPIQKIKGDYLYAGGKQLGGSITVQIAKKVNQSYLTSLWNQETFQNKKSAYKSVIDKVSRYFTIAILSISLISVIAWYFIDASQILNVFTSILIIACPCALALTVPFTLGNAIRQLGKKGFYVKSTETIENLNNIDTVIFDKTGTITNTKSFDLSYEGIDLTTEQKAIIKSVCNNSAHPLSQSLVKRFEDLPTLKVDSFMEVLGKGIFASYKCLEIKIGKGSFANDPLGENTTNSVSISINKEFLGRFQFKSQLRPEFTVLQKKLNKNHQLHLLSGDGSKDKGILQQYFSANQLHFNQSPIDKLNYVKSLQEKGSKVLMIGDGLNDAGALKQSQVGIAISDDVYAFSPACDGILAANSFSQLHNIIQYSKKCMSVVKGGFALSFIYNIVGISLAVSNFISPVVSAILMPLSSITIVLFSNLSSNILAKKHLK